MYKPVMLFLFIAILMVLPAAYAEQALQVSNEPVEITADRLEANEALHSIVFIGNAEARQGDVTIYADRLTIFYQDKQNEIERVMAQGNVRIVQFDRIATGEKAEFFRNEGRIVLSGQPRVSEGNSFVEGQMITLFLNDKRSVVSGGDEGRVNAVFQPKTESKP
ncbi:MAG: lipopolysaccharide transport periplasmic protein LptA [Deltaproteobacteria bacterium]|jgi:lipopolysaccharide export system protein LptA|nr:lipopolysaccharide transport periplasmic protein LptA [Deltaproteobacteria bacterium]